MVQSACEMKNIHNRTFSTYFWVFIFSHSTFDVGRSLFDVHLFQYRRKGIVQ